MFFKRGSQNAYKESAYSSFDNFLRKQQLHIIESKNNAKKKRTVRERKEMAIINSFIKHLRIMPYIKITCFIIPVW